MLISFRVKQQTCGL